MPRNGWGEVFSGKEFFLARPTFSELASESSRGFSITSLNLEEDVYLFKRIEKNWDHKWKGTFNGLKINHIFDIQTVHQCSLPFILGQIHCLTKPQLTFVTFTSLLTETQVGFFELYGGYSYISGLSSLIVIIVSLGKRYF